MFSDAQKEMLGAKLDARAVKTRQQAGRTLSYLEGWHAIAEANRIFGFDGWTRETVEMRQVVEAPRKIGQQQKDGWMVAYTAKCRLNVLGVIREGVGYGSGIDVDLGAAHESAIKEAETDAMKRGLMTFGNPFGLALYDKAQENVERETSIPGRTPADEFYERAKIAISNHTDPVKLKAWVDDNFNHLNALPQEKGRHLYDQYQKRMAALAQAPSKAA